MDYLPSDDNSFDGEEELRTDVHIAIELALDNVLEKQKREITKVEEEKLTYFAIEQLDLDLTYSWYLAGANAKADFNAKTEMELGVDQQFGTHQKDTPQTDRLTKLRDFFENEVFFDKYSLQKIWWEKRFSFLRDFYESCAPKKYRDIYIISTNIKEKLYNIDDIIKTRSDNTTLSDFNAGGNNAVLAPSDEKEIRYLISDLHLELASVEELSNTKKVVASGTDLIEQVLFKLTQKETTTGKQQKILKELHNFFYYYVWKYPALLISADTASGPNAEVLKLNKLQEFNNFSKEIEREQEKLANRCYDEELLPNIEDYTSLNIDEESNIILPDDQTSQE